MEYRRITALPPYVFTIIDTLKVEARRAGRDVIDLGVGFGPGGEGHVRFALIENEQRIAQAVRSLRGCLDRLG
ncbi:MAG: hypothetical protein H8E59_03365 [Actinobacteria bacterium]|nr:hypothetical protein [Actinomycetota bacterium]